MAHTETIRYWNFVVQSESVANLEYEEKKRKKQKSLVKSYYTETEINKIEKQKRTKLVERQENPFALSIFNAKL